MGCIDLSARAGLGDPIQVTMKKMDYVVILLVLMVAASVFAFNLTDHESGAYVEIAKDGKITHVIQLQKDQTVVIEDNDQYNVVEIKAGEVRMSEANCRDQLCVHTAPIKSVSRAIVCLPHRVSITITGADDKDGLDGFSE